MLIEIKRHHTNDLYSEGRFYINDMLTTHTVEATDCMLPAGIYQLRIVKKSARKQSLVIFLDDHPTDWSIGIGLSWIGSKKNRIIAIGQPFFPGAVNRAAPIFERITDRLMKCEARGESIQLIISDDQCIPCKPIRYWTEPANHGCPPSNRRVERIDDRTYDIYDGDVFLRTVIIPEKETLA